MSRIHGPVRTYRNAGMNTRPGDVVVIDKWGSRVVKVDAPGLPTFENYSYREDDSGFGATPSTFDITSVLANGYAQVATRTATNIRADQALTTPAYEDFDDPRTAQKAARAFAIATGTATTVVGVNGRWIVQSARSAKR